MTLYSSDSHYDLASFTAGMVIGVLVTTFAIALVLAS